MIWTNIQLWLKENERLSFQHQAEQTDWKWRLKVCVCVYERRKNQPWMKSAEHIWRTICRLKWSSNNHKRECDWNPAQTLQKSGRQASKNGQGDIESDLKFKNIFKMTCLSSVTKSHFVKYFALSFCQTKKHFLHPR